MCKMAVFEKLFLSYKTILNEGLLTKEKVDMIQQMTKIKLILR